MRKLTIILVLSLIMVAGLTAGIAAQDLRIGLAVSTLNNPFFVDLKEGAESMAEEMGVEILVVDAQDDAAAQLSSVEDLLIKQIDVLIVNPVDGNAVVSAITAANDAGVPVITVDRGAEGGNVASHIASDNVAGGEMAGDFIAEQLGETGKVVELEGIPGTSAARDRGEGFNKAMDKYPDLEVIARQPAAFDRAEGMTVMENILQGNPEIDAVFAHNDNMALGAMEAIEAAGRSDEIMIVGFDAIDDAREAVTEGNMAATVAQKPALMGEMSVEIAVKVVNGEEVDEYTPVPLELITE
ncbi:ribose ABC transporter substrate-binding protein RbsB [Halanaerobium congolense]|jgi:ribose transport system substrate-binding protein|uniref:Ribose transport system substrate-binding protein n=1 Tax=Halanaerobium congolense TaxID=54121 RepID=A0A1G9UL73_9FIRM|nr:ribose ABC transporter substrate-binding protein RbsB [Halanaerobium congolense]PXV68227.1 ribose transport system substrate-binding protein [Halanaerobium congolense]TDS35423.1 ribose transport system substrate-binding protein [Halanaerobium congolense]SDK82370.1 ribose transport system substrate-binding protein [Halanaerobium congolense]SDM60617.1 ribose transport system substrate-binding protein [Halanaerobium congolense]